MISDSRDEGAIDLEAARLALAALAGMVPPYEPLDADRVRVAPDAAVLTRERAARLLASMPKPLICNAEISAGVLVVKCELLAELGPADQARYARRQSAGGGVDKIFGDLPDGGDALVGVFSRDASLFVRLESVKRWFRDYGISHVSWSFDNVDNVHGKNDPAYLESRRRGARSIMRFTSAAGHVSTMDGERLRFPLPESASADDRRKVERMFVDMAKQLLFEIEEEEELAAVERGLVERGEIPADSTDSYPGGGVSFAHGMLASQMRKFFEGREMPAECVAFIDACREA